MSSPGTPGKRARRERMRMIITVVNHVGRDDLSQNRWNHHPSSLVPVLEPSSRPIRHVILGWRNAPLARPTTRFAHLESRAVEENFRRAPRSCEETTNCSAPKVRSDADQPSRRRTDRSFRDREMHGCCTRTCRNRARSDSFTTNPARACRSGPTSRAIRYTCLDGDL